MRLYKLFENICKKNTPVPGGAGVNKVSVRSRKHFQKKDEQPAAPAANAMSTNVIQQVVEQAAPSASQVKTRPLANVIVFDAALFPQLYNSSSTFTLKSSFLDESFC